MGTQKKYICAFCARAFTRSEHKQRHERSHTNEKPFHCLRCTLSFVRRDLLQRHCRTVHNIQVMPRDDEDPLLRPVAPPAPPQPQQDMMYGLGHLPPMEPLPYPVTVVEGPAIDKLSLHDLIHLLLITRKLEGIIDVTGDSETTCKDAFLIGYTHLIKVKLQFPVFEKILSDLVNYLHQFNQHKEVVLLVKVGIIYLICACGYVINHNYERLMALFGKLWTLLINQLIPNYNQNNNLLDQIEILNNLFLLSYVYMEHHLLRMDDDFVTDEIILNYLNDISSIIVGNLGDDLMLVDLNLDLFWGIYILLSSYLPEHPPKFYRFFLDKPLGRGAGPDTLVDVMTRLARLCLTVPLGLVGLDNAWRAIIILTLRNELKRFLMGDDYVIFTLKNSLHNLIILVNKLFSVGVDGLVAGGVLPRLLVSVSESTGNLFALFKKNCIINAPQKFHELLSNYLLVPTHYYHWELLAVTLNEINVYYPLHSLLVVGLLDPQLNQLQLLLYNFLNNKQNVVEINNNLLIISFPIIFLAQFLNLGFFSVAQFNHHQLMRVNLVIVEWYVVLIKILLHIWNEPLVFDDNYILQLLVYLLLDNKAHLLNFLNPPLPGSLAELIEPFEFNQKWFFILKMKFDLIFENWFEFCKFKGPENLGISQLKMAVHLFVESVVVAELLKMQAVEWAPPSQPSSTSGLVLGVLGLMMTPAASLSLHLYERRSNLITLGMLQHQPGQVPGTQAHHQYYPPPADSLPLMTHTNGYNSFVRQGSQGLALLLRNGLNAGPLSRLLLYLTYAPPIVPGPRENLLPPILPKTSADKMKLLIPGVARKNSD